MAHVTNEDFLDFIAFVLTDGSPESVAALNRAIDHIRAPATESSNASLQYNREIESGPVV